MKKGGELSDTFIMKVFLINQHFRQKVDAAIQNPYNIYDMYATCGRIETVKKKEWFQEEMSETLATEMTQLFSVLHTT